MLVQPYLFFEGRAEEALGFYREALGADLHGTSVFAEAEDGGVFHTCSTCARGAELLSGAFNRLGLAPKGRNEQGIVSWVRPHDGHGDAPADAGCCRRWTGGNETMRVMVLVKATKDSEAGVMPSTELLEAMGRYNEELAEAGIMQAGEGLRPSSEGKRVAFDGAGRSVVDGPSAATVELVAGFWLGNVKDVAEAVERVKRCPSPMPGPSEIEIRPLNEMTGFGEALAPEVAELRDRTRGTTSGR